MYLFISYFHVYLQSHDDHSDDEMRECDSVEEDHISRIGSRLNTSMTSNSAVTSGDINGSDHINDISMR